MFADDHALTVAIVLLPLRSFGTEMPYISVHMEHRRVAALEVEPNCWMVCTLTNPVVEVHKDDLSRSGAEVGGAASGAAAATAAAAVDAKSAKKSTAAAAAAAPSDSVVDNVLERIMRAAWKMYCLFYGPVSETLGRDGARAHHERLQATRKKVRKAKNAAEALDMGMVEDTEENRAKAAVLPLLVEELRKLEGVDGTSPSPAEVVRRSLHGLLSGYFSTVDFARPHLLYGLDGVVYHSVNRGPYLRVQHFLSLLSLTFPFVKDCAVLFDGQLIWSSVLQPRLLSLLLFLRVHATSVLRAAGARLRSGGTRAYPAAASPPPLRAAAIASKRPTGFQVVPCPFALLPPQSCTLGRAAPDAPAGEGSSDESPDGSAPPDASLGVDGSKGGATVFAPRVVLEQTAVSTPDGGPGAVPPLRVLWYQFNHISLLLFVDLDNAGEGDGSTGEGDTKPPPDLERACSQVEEAVRPHLQQLHELLDGPVQAEALRAAPGGARPSGPRILYFNSVNYAVKLSGVSGFAGGAERTRDAVGFFTSDASMRALPQEMILTLDSVFATFRREERHAESDPGVTEVLVRSLRSGVLVARRSSGRELYVVVEVARGATAADAYASVNRLLEGEGFKNIFMG